jgi:hypothetical protein
MTRLPPLTKARLRGAIEAARKAGLRVTGIRQDGTGRRGFDAAGCSEPPPVAS